MRATDDPDADGLPGDGRDETATERYDRNWIEILQELRVTQAGTQVLTGFLVSVAFQPRFTSLDDFERTVYLVLVALAAVSTGLGLAPVTLHRLLFRKRAKRELVHLGNALLIATLATVGLLVSGVVLLVFDVALSERAGIIAGAVALVAIAAIWLLLPPIARARQQHAERHGRALHDD